MSEDVETGPASEPTEGSGRRRPDWAGNERDQLSQVLDYQRVTARMKCEGLTDEQARRRLLPSPLTTIAGVVSHLIWVEHFWMEFVLAGLPDEAPWTDEDPDADWAPGDTPLAELLDSYDARCAHARAIVESLDLDLVPGHEGRPPISVRAALLHMIEETARHLGHLDILRELTDGATGE
ncbi:MAG: DinB family protein [Nocardioidaceae bacterium]